MSKSYRIFRKIRIFPQAAARTFRAGWKPRTSVRRAFSPTPEGFRWDETAGPGGSDPDSLENAKISNFRKFCKIQRNQHDLRPLPPHFSHFFPAGRTGPSGVVTFSSKGKGRVVSG